MIPLTVAPAGEEHIIKRIGGNEEVRHHLESLGFTAGAAVKVISTLSASVIVNVKDSRVAIGKDMAAKIMV